MQNLVLERLRSEERAHILDCSTRVVLEQGDLLHESNMLIDSVYFPQEGCVSLLTVAHDGRAIETGVVGREGLVGGAMTLGAPRSGVRATVTIKGHALKLPMSDFLRLKQSLPGLSALVDQHVRFLLFQAQHNAVCHALHSVEARLCRWILQASDTLGSNLVELTQESCSNSLGVQRTSVSMVAHALQVAGYLRTRRGKILVLNRAELEKTACECYRTVKQQSNSVFAEAAIAA